MKKTISVITGGAGSFGRATAAELGKRGPVLLGDLNEEALAKAKEMLEVFNIEVYTMKMDVRDKASTEAFATYAASLGDVKYVVNIAGVCPLVSYSEASISSPELTYVTNAIGTVYVTDAFYNIMAEGGVLINFASLAGHYFQMDTAKKEIFDSFNEDGFLDKLIAMTTSPDTPAYNLSAMAYLGSKAFVLHYSKKNAKRFAAKDCRILTISPGAHWTQHVWVMGEEGLARTKGSQAIQRWGKTSEIGAIVGFLCGDSACFMTGCDVLADGGSLAGSSAKQI